MSRTQRANPINRIGTTTHRDECSDTLHGCIVYYANDGKRTRWTELFTAFTRLANYDKYMCCVRDMTSRHENISYPATVVAEPI